MEKFVANGYYSFTFVFTFSVIVVDQPTDCILSFLFPAETDVLDPVFSQSTDVVIVNFVVVLKFPIIITIKTCQINSRLFMQSPIKHLNSRGKKYLVSFILKCAWKVYYLMRRPCYGFDSC